MHLRKPNLCANHLELQEADGSLTRFHRVRSPILGRWSTHGRYLPVSIHGIWSLQCNIRHQKTTWPKETCCVNNVRPVTTDEQKPKSLTSEGCCLKEIDHVDPNAQLSHRSALTAKLSRQNELLYMFCNGWRCHHCDVQTRALFWSCDSGPRRLDV